MQLNIEKLFSIKTGDIFPSWVAMCRHFDLDTSKYPQQMKDKLNTKLNNRIIWESAGRGRTIRITGVCSIDKDTMEVILETKHAGRTDDCLSSAILSAEKYIVTSGSEHAAKVHDSLNKFREDILNEEVQVLLVTPKQLIRCLGFRIRPERFGDAGTTITKHQSTVKQTGKANSNIDLDDPTESNIENNILA